MKKIIRRIYSLNEYNKSSFPNIEDLLTEYIFNQGITKKDIHEKISVLYIAENNPYLLCRIFETVIQKILMKFVINKSHIEDIKQDLIFNLLEKRIKLALNNYRPGVSFVVYFTKIIINSCISIQKKYIDKHKSFEDTIGQIEEKITDNIEIDPKIVIDFKRIMTPIFNNKMILVLKVSQNHILLENEIEKSFPLISTWDKKKYSDLLNSTGNRKLEILTELFNKYERKNIKVRSLQRTLNLYISNVCSAFNQATPHNFNTNDIKNLFYYYYSNCDSEIEKEHA